MTIGPVEYMIVGFPGNRFTGEIAPELAKLVEAGTVRILDLIFVGKAADGTVTTFEFDQRDELAGFAAIDGEVGAVSVATAPLIKDAPGEGQAASPARGDAPAICPAPHPTGQGGLCGVSAPGRPSHQAGAFGDPGAGVGTDLGVDEGFEFG